MRRIAAETGLTAHVRTSGGRVDGRAPLEYYEMADACVFPSLFEPFGLVATEAMAMARPAILGEGFSRIFLGEPARTVTEVLTDPAPRRDLARRGERLVRGLSWSRAAPETLKVYESAATPAGDLAAGHPMPRPAAAPDGVSSRPPTGGRPGHRRGPVAAGPSKMSSS